MEATQPNRTFVFRWLKQRRNNNPWPSCRCVEMVINEQIRLYNEKMEEIEQLEYAEALAVNQLKLKRQNTVRRWTPNMNPCADDFFKIFFL